MRTAYWPTFKLYVCFRTHYFEITALAESLTGAKNVHLDAVNHGGEIIFLYEVKEGATNQSYGIQVARLAGIPSKVIAVASEKLVELSMSVSKQAVQIDEQLFQPSIFDPQAKLNSPALDRLSEVQPDNISPREALEILYQLKQLHKD